MNLKKIEPLCIEQMEERQEAASATQTAKFSIEYDKDGPVFTGEYEIRW